MFQLIQFLMILFNQYLNKKSHDYFLVMALPPVPLIINLTGVVDTTPVKLIGGSKGSLPFASHQIVLFALCRFHNRMIKSL